MRLLRVLLAGVLVLVILAGVAVEVALRNQTRLVDLVLARINAGTGLDIRPARTRLSFRGHLGILLEQPTVFFHGHQVATLDDLLAVVNYHAILVGNGLPLHSLELDRPVMRMPASAAGVTPHGLPKPDIDAADNLLATLDAIEDVTYRVELHDAELHDIDLAPLIDRFNVVAYKEHRNSGQWPWLINFDAHWTHAPLSGLEMSGGIRLGGKPGRNSDIISGGQARFSGLNLSGFDGPDGLKAAGAAAGEIHFTMLRNGEVSGTAYTDFTKLAVSGNPLRSPIALGDCALRAKYNATAARIALSEVAITRGQISVVAGGMEIGAPYDADRTLKLNLVDGNFAIADAAAAIRKLRATPPWLGDALARAGSGQIQLATASLAAAEPLRNWTALTLRDNLQLKARLSGGGFDPSAGSRLPPIGRVAADLTYAHGRLTLNQGSGTLGRSSMRDLVAEANFRDAPRAISYRIKGRGKIDAGEVYALATPLLAAAPPSLARRLRGATGTASVAGGAAGRIVAGKLGLPADYSFTVAPKWVQFKVRGAPFELALSGGAIILRPGVVRLDRLIASRTVAASGNVTLTGTIEPAAPFPRLRDFVIEAHGLRAERWLPLFVDEKQLNVRGPISGRLVVNSGASKNAAPMVTGKLTMGPGDLVFGFVRSPVVVGAATLVLDGTGLELRVPGATLEDQPLDLTMKIANLAQPRMQIEARAAAVDFEVLKFIRMPWSPKTKVTVFPIPIFGHLQAARANFGKLEMTSMATDFERGGGHWRVYNFTTRALGGRARLAISGLTTPDNWIHITGRATAMDAARVFMLTGNRQPPIVGTLATNVDLWADADVDFFSSMRGKLGIEATDGTLNRFVLVSRILSFIDVKNWLTARLPDPRAAGIPFKTLSCDAQGVNGIFKTKNLKLLGPVLEIAARGSVNVVNDTMNMELALIPFDTFNWLVSHIPLIGWNLAEGSKGLVAPYFHVYGPINDPTVVPQPITSVAKFLAKVLSMPVNIIVPNTIKP